MLLVYYVALSSGRCYAYKTKAVIKGTSFQPKPSSLRLSPSRGGGKTKGPVKAVFIKNCVTVVLRSQPIEVGLLQTRSEARRHCRSLKGQGSRNLKFIYKLIFAGPAHMSRFRINLKALRNGVLVLN